MRLKNPCNFSICKIFLYTFYAYPDLLRMMCIIIYKSQTWQVNPYIKPAPYPLEEHDSLSDFLFCYTAHHCYSNSCSKIFDINNTGESEMQIFNGSCWCCLLYTSPSPRD